MSCELMSSQLLGRLCGSASPPPPPVKPGMGRPPALLEFLKQKDTFTAYYIPKSTSMGYPAGRDGLEEGLTVPWAGNQLWG